jgi:hypothetical protein
MTNHMPNTTARQDDALSQGLDIAPTMEIDLRDWVQAHSTPNAEMQADHALCPQTEPGTPGTSDPQPQDLVLSASRKIVLQCGLASITLHANGKVVLRGQSIVSAAEGINRLSGGQIEIN